MMLSFQINRSAIENEFEMAHFDPNTGLDSTVLAAYLESESKKACENLFNHPTSAKPIPIVWSELFAYLLDHAQLEINPKTVFSVKLNIGIDYHSTASQDIFGTKVFYPQRDRVLKKRLPTEYDEMHRLEWGGVGTSYTDFWHTLPDWEFLIAQGFSGILQYAKTKKAGLPANSTVEQRIFLDSVILRYEAILRFMNRVCDYALGRAEQMFLTAMQNLTENPPKDTYEVMLFQILYLYFEEIGVERARSLGRVDLLYAPFIHNDIASGRYSEEEIRELWRFFFIHFTATKRFAQQPMLIGGSDMDGNDMCNDVTAMILDVYDAMNIYDPKIHVRYHKNFSDKILLKLLDMTRRGNSSICILNDAAVLAGYQRIGVEKADAIKYGVLGCYEPVAVGMEDAEIAVSWFNLEKPLEILWHNGCSMSGVRLYDGELPSADSYGDFDSFMKQYLHGVCYFIDRIVALVEVQSVYNTEMNPSPLISSSYQTCLDAAADVHTWCLKYNNISLKCFALATVTDSLCVVKRYVYEKKLLTIGELWEVLRQNWKSDMVLSGGMTVGELRTVIQADRDKYGCNSDYADSIMTTITETIAAHSSQIRLKRGGRLRVGLDSITNCLYAGRGSAATPDGRLSGVSLSRNLCAVAGMDREGITGYMQSVLKIDAAAFVDSAPLDYVLHPSTVAGEKGLEAYYSLVKVFFDAGGFAMQGNIISGKTLEEAQKHPDEYSTLQVRICGWNEYFTRMNPAQQRHFIDTFRV